jgi:hypothetical protein
VPCRESHINLLVRRGLVTDCELLSLALQSTIG